MFRNQPTATTNSIGSPTQYGWKFVFDRANINQKAMETIAIYQRSKWIRVYTSNKPKQNKTHAHLPSLLGYCACVHVICSSQKFLFFFLLRSKSLFFEDFVGFPSSSACFCQEKKILFDSTSSINSQRALCVSVRNTPLPSHISIFYLCTTRIIWTSKRYGSLICCMHGKRHQQIMNQ